jgi:hypothetical protein
MNVDMQFIAWYSRANREPSRRARSDRRVVCSPSKAKRVVGPNHTVPSGTGPLFDSFQAINCLATIIQSLRDNIFAYSSQTIDSVLVRARKGALTLRLVLKLECDSPSLPLV